MIDTRFYIVKKNVEYIIGNLKKNIKRCQILPQKKNAERIWKNPIEWLII